MFGFTGFSLSEINQMFQLMRACDINNFPMILEILKEKRGDLAKRVRVFQSMIEYIDEAEEAMLDKKDMSYIAKIDMLVTKMFKEIKELREELK